MFVMGVWVGRMECHRTVSASVKNKKIPAASPVCWGRCWNLENYQRSNGRLNAGTGPGKINFCASKISLWLAGAGGTGQELARCGAARNSLRCCLQNAVAEAASNIRQHCMVSYDDVPEIRALYQDFQYVSYSLSYCAQNRYRGTEAIFLGASLECPGLKASMKAA